MQNTESSIAYIVNDPNTIEDVVAFSKALSSPDRVRILNLLGARSMNLLEISRALDIPVSSVSFHIDYLEKARIIRVDYQPAPKGHMKLCSLALVSAHLSFVSQSSPHTDGAVSVEQGVGHYCDCCVENAYLVGPEKFIFRESDYREKLFCSERFEGQLFSFTAGHALYRFPNVYLEKPHLSKLTASFEVCSEAPFYRNKWPSDITVWINGVEIATYTSPGDFGGRRGNFSPEFWMIDSTQFGLLKEFSIDPEGTYLDGSLFSKKNAFGNLGLDRAHSIDVTIGIKNDARYKGGINLFGPGFGDFPQGIVLTLSKA